ncbi:hypothetical protein ACN42_g7511 [Penicillium freii]|uniref:Uncharacterized protein n=1 Tax=Penicillium freii TaxID=48697 RepID=A0A101MFI2_PENFR|nr:hypothetical protein ACN42_g7511 [Penicillium freii]
MALLADYVVSVFGFPVPSNRICILWDESAWEAAVTKADPIWEQRSESITTAFVEANKPEDETLAIIDAIKQFMETRKEFHEQRACQDERGRGRGREWLKTIGRRALQSLAPRKSLRAKPHGSDRDHRRLDPSGVDPIKPTAQPNPTRKWAGFRALSSGPPVGYGPGVKA